MKPLLFSLMMLAGLTASNPSLADGLSLREVMQQLGQDLQQLQAALVDLDFPAVAAAATTIADHPTPSMRERGRVISTLGSDMGHFKAADGRVHDDAVALAAAATAGDAARSRELHRDLVAGCMACHAEFRDRLKAAAETTPKPVVTP